MEKATIFLFCAILIGCVAAGITVVAALLAGLVLFLLYGKWKGFTWGELGRMALSGVLTARTILILMVLIGLMTALWRAAGCIPAIICYASGLIHPGVFVLLAFLLNAGLSFLTGTSFGTAATMGVICMSIAQTMQMNVLWVGGAILSGAFFGDRCSPVSTSCLLVCELTKTDLYRNLRRMMKTGMVPLLLTCLIYLAAGLLPAGSSGGVDVYGIFSPEFRIHPLCLIPAALILLCAFLRVRVLWTLGISIVAAFLTALLVQHASLWELVKTMIRGYRASHADLAPILNGGGVLSMVQVLLILTIACSYTGLFQETGLMDFMKRGLTVIARKSHPFFSVLLTSILSSMISCNQTLAIMLSHQLCDHLGMKKEKLAIVLEDTVVVLAPLVPWSIAGSVPLASIGAPMVCLLFACYLYLIPLWQSLVHWRMVYKRRRLEMRD